MNEPPILPDEKIGIPQAIGAALLAWALSFAVVMIVFIVFLVAAGASIISLDNPQEIFEQGSFWLLFILGMLVLIPLSFIAEMFLVKIFVPVVSAFQISTGRAALVVLLGFGGGIAGSLLDGMLIYMTLGSLGILGTLAAMTWGIWMWATPKVTVSPVATQIHANPQPPMPPLDTTTS